MSPALCPPSPTLSLSGNGEICYDETELEGGTQHNPGDDQWSWTQRRRLVFNLEDILTCLIEKSELRDQNGGTRMWDEDGGMRT